MVYDPEGDGYLGDRQSLRSRHGSSRPSNQNYPQFDWGSRPAEEDEGRSEELPPDLRNSPLPMALKRAVREVQQMRVPVVSRKGSWKIKREKSLRKLRDNIRGFLHTFGLWSKTLQKIGGNFGGGVKSYFLFLRFLVVLNFVSSLLIVGFVLVPSIVFNSEAPSSVNSMGQEECRNYNPYPQGLVPFYNYFVDILSGTGFMEYSYMFYGYYNDTHTRVVDQAFSYNIPLAYLLTAVFYFAVCLLCIIARMGAAARIAVATGGSAVANYSMIVFTSWNYGCLGERATRLKQKNIHYRLQVNLEEEILKNKAASLTLTRKIILYSVRVFMFFLAIGFIFGAFYCIFLATNLSQERSNQEGILGLIFQYLPSIVITIGNFVVPMLCDLIALAERYTPSNTVIVSLLRAVFLRLVSLGVLLFTLWRQITCEGDISSSDCVLCEYNYKTYQIICPIIFHHTFTIISAWWWCWETRVGQEMYKLTLFDLLINIAVLILVEFPRRMVVDNWSCKLAQMVGRQEFVVSSNVLGLVYAQTVVWTGALFCPLLPLINSVKFVILFYCKKITLFYNCRPAQRTFRSTTSAFFFLVVLLFGWGLATVVMVYSLAEIRPSMGCGPFRSFKYMWLIVPESFASLSEVSREFLFFIGSQAFSIPLCVLSCVVLWYFTVLTSVHGKCVALLRAQLKLERRDKQFLVKQIEALNKQIGTSSLTADSLD